MTLRNVTHKFFQSICNCSDFCITLNDIICSPDNTVTVVVTLKEKQPLFLKNQVYTKLKDGQVEVEFEGQNYTVLCVVKTLCEVPTPPTPVITSSDVNSAATDETNETNVLIPIIIVVTVAITVFLILLMLGGVMLWVRKYKVKTKQSTTKESNPQTILHALNPLQQTSMTEAAAGNPRPSTSSEESGYISPENISPTGSIDEPIQSDIHSTENSNANLPNGNARTDPVANCIIPSSTEHNRNRINKMKPKSKHHRSTPLNDGLPNIRWSQNNTYSSQNNTYSSLNFANQSNLPATVPVPPVTREPKINLYDDIEGIDESTRRATAGHKTKYPQPRLPGRHVPIRTQHQQPVHNQHNHTVTIRGTGTKLAPINHNRPYCNVSASQV